MIMPTFGRNHATAIVWDGQYNTPVWRRLLNVRVGEQGLEQMRELNTAGTAAGLIGALLLATVSTQASAQKMSDRSVKTIMSYAWSYTPDKFTPPSGKTVFIDKKNREKMTVPVEKGREIIMAARLTAHAQICDLTEDQVKNYRSLMVRENRSKKWSPQQMVYINQLHLTTVMMLVGKLQIVEQKGDKKVVVKEGSAPPKTCTDEQKKKIKELIAKYVASGPDLSAAKSPVQAAKKEQ